MANASSTNAPHYRRDIDGLRAIAVLCVLGFHAFPFWFPNGFIGVDIFFVISGFLISNILLKNLEANTFSFSDFFIRRIRRIFPALVTVLFASFCLGWLALFAQEFAQLGKHIAGAAVFISNLIYWQEVGYFDNAADTKPLLHLWSLSIEEQFYILWPLLLFLCFRLRQNPAFLITLLLGISFYLNITGVRHDAIGTFYALQSRAWELLIGALVALLLRNQNSYHHFSSKIFTRIAQKTIKQILSIFALTAIIFCVFGMQRIVQFPGYWALIPTIATASLLLAGVNTSINSKVLSHPILTWIGLISYPLYLWHWPLLSFARIIEGETPQRNIRLLSLALALIFAWLTYQFIERPLRFGSQARIKVGALVIALSSLAILGYLTWKSDGWPDRMIRQETINAQFEWDRTLNSNAACRAKYPGDEYCNITDLSAPPTAALIGDSHANHFFPGLSAYYAAKGGNLLNLGAGACPPFFDMDRGQHPGRGVLRCFERTKPMFEYILNSPSINTVYLAFHHLEFFRNDVAFIQRRPGINLFSDNFENTTQALIHTIKTLKERNKEVVIIYDLPDLKKDIKSCFISRPFTLTARADCDYQDLIIWNEFELYDQMLKRVAKESPVRVIETHPYVGKYFPVNEKGIPTYRDSSHLSLEGSLFFKDKF